MKTTTHLESTRNYFITNAENRIIMPYFRRRYRTRRRGYRGKAPIQSFKKVLNYAGASRGASAIIDFTIVTGVDSVAAGQTSVTDTQVPTGATVKYFDITYGDSNLVAVSYFNHKTIQLVHSGQTRIDPRTVGGDPQRNQVFYQRLDMLGKEQNGTYRIRFKVPPRFQRVREGDKWQFTVVGDQVHTDICQIIYKFYR